MAVLIDQRGAIDQFRAPAKWATSPDPLDFSDWVKEALSKVEEIKARTPAQTAKGEIKENASLNRVALPPISSSTSPYQGDWFGMIPNRYDEWRMRGADSPKPLGQYSLAGHTLAEAACGPESRDASSSQIPWHLIGPLSTRAWRSETLEIEPYASLQQVADISVVSLLSGIGIRSISCSLLDRGI